MRITTYTLAFVTCLLASPVVDAQQAQAETKSKSAKSGLDALDFFVGSWEGTGTAPGGTSKNTCRIEKKLSGKVLTITTHSTISGEKPDVHEDMGIVSFNKATGKVTFRQYHAEGYMNRYQLELHDNGTRLVFTSDLIENFAPNWTARVTMVRKGADKFDDMLELKPPGKDWFRCCQTSYQRVQPQASSMATGWTSLLGPETHDLTTHWTTTGNWSLKNGIASLTPRAGEKGWQRYPAYLWSKKSYADFEIEFDYKLEKRGNSGFYFRVGDVNDPVSKGIEVQIYDTDPKKPREKLSDHDAGGVIPGLKPHRNAAKKAGEWNTMVVRHFDNKFVVRLNGVTVNAHDMVGGGQLSQRPEVGRLGFQDHGLPMSIRNVRIRELPTAKNNQKAPERRND